MLRVVFVEPEIPPNTGNAIRLVACTPAELHLIEPLGFDVADKNLKRAGLDYHDLAKVTVHPNLQACFDSFEDEPRVFAFTRKATTSYADIAYRDGDVLLFGRESRGLDDDVLASPRITEALRIPMLAGRRSLNLSNCAALVVYEAWRQSGFGSPPSAG